MKKLLVIMGILLSTMLISNAQKQNFQPSHELRAGYIGGLANISLTTIEPSSFYYNNDFTLDNYKNKQAYLDDNFRSIGGFSLGYRYNIKKWLSFGVDVSYSKFVYKKHDRITEELVSKEVNNFISVLPTVKFQYLNRPIVSLYSQVGIGIGINNAYLNENDKISHRRTTTQFISQFTAIGVNVGRSLFGFAEIGYGSEGNFKVGIGYKFKKIRK